MHYLALEWAQGEPLAEFVNRSGKLAPAAGRDDRRADRRRALGAAHKAGIIHRDLKPANIMYDPATQTAKLLDFGIARDAELNPEERLTRAGFFVGTLQYVAPETLSGELVNEQADVYSLATIAYYLLTQELPFTGKSPRELFQQLLTQPPVPLNQADKGLRVLAGRSRRRSCSGLDAGLVASVPRRWTNSPRTFCTAVRSGRSPSGGFLRRCSARAGMSDAEQHSSSSCSSARCGLATSCSPRGSAPPTT